MNAHTAARMPVECWVDGGVFGRNPSPRGVYWSVLLPDGSTVRRQDRTKRFSTNSEAEWLALREVLLWAVSVKLRRPLIVHTDSRHVVDCYNEKKLIKVEQLLLLKNECRELAVRLPLVVVRWVSREISLVKLGH